MDQRVEEAGRVGRAKVLAQLGAGLGQEPRGLGPDHVADLDPKPPLELADLAKHPIDLLARGTAALLELGELLLAQLALLDQRGEALGRDRLALDQRQDHRLRDPARLAHDQREPSRRKLALERLGQQLDLGQRPALELAPPPDDDLALQRRR